MTFLKDKNNCFDILKGPKPPLNLENKELQNLGLSQKELPLLLGGILGDGSLKINKKYVNARYSFRHSILQKAYFDWKVEQLKGLCAKNCVFLQKADGFSKLQKLRFSTAAKPVLTRFQEITHKGNTLEIKRSWLNHLTPLALTVWWCDDGSIIKKGREGIISTEGFSDEAQIILKNYLLVAWNIEVKLCPVKKTYKGVEKNYTRLGLTTNNLKKLLTIVMPEIPCKEMVYKCMLRYKDQQCQERWISQMEESLPKDLKKVPKELVQKLKDQSKNSNETILV